MARVRPYASSDLEAIIAVFTNAVRHIAARDYTPEQIEAWAPRHVDRAHWERRCAHRSTWVAEIGGRIAGFAILEPGGHLDMLYVHSDHARRGVASALLRRVEAVARAQGLEWLRTEASVTARPFFERRGFRVVAPQLVTLRGQTFVNDRMAKRISGASLSSRAPEHQSADDRRS
jgi:putative acetyltransferase